MGTFNPLTAWILLDVFAISLCRLGRAVHAQQRGSAKVEPFATVFRLRVLSRDSIVVGKSFVVTTLLKVGTPDAEKRSRNVFVLWVVFRKRFPMFACFRKGAIRQVDVCAAQMFTWTQALEFAIRVPSRAIALARGR